MTNSDRLSDSDWLSYVEAAARGDMDGDPDATKALDEMGPAAVILRLVGMVRERCPVCPDPRAWASTEKMTDWKENFNCEGRHHE